MLAFFLTPLSGEGDVRSQKKGIPIRSIYLTPWSSSSPGTPALASLDPPWAQGLYNAKGLEKALKGSGAL